MQIMSQDIKELVAALIKAQGEIKVAPRDRANPFFKSKYADLAGVWDACREALQNNKFAVTQVVSPSEGSGFVLKTILLHESGQYITSDFPLNPTADTPQGVGSAVTYARRYALAAIVGVVTDDDDDGNAASAPAAKPFKKEWPAKQQYAPKPAFVSMPSGVITVPEHGLGGVAATKGTEALRDWWKHLSKEDAAILKEMPEKIAEWQAIAAAADAKNTAGG